MTRHVLHLADDLAKQRCIRSLQSAPVRDDKGRTLTVVIYRVKQRTAPLPVKGYAYALWTIMADHTGSTLEEIKRAIKDECLPLVETVNPLTGELRMERQHTEHLEPHEWAVLVDRTIALAEEFLGLTLPPPESDEARRALRHHQHAAAAA